MKSTDRNSTKQKVAKSGHHDNTSPKITHLVLVLVVAALVIAGITYFRLSVTDTPKLLPESDTNSMTKLPDDVQKHLAQQTKTATISATLHIPILMYHYVEYVQDKNDKERQLLNVNPDVFEKQIQTLVNAHYNFLTAKQLGDVFDGKMPIPNKPIVLTFDDGHQDFDTNVIPILKKYQVHVTAYIIPGFVGTTSDFLSPSQLQDVINSGLVDVGAHTVHHISLKGKSSKQAWFEIETSKAILEQQYHILVYSFAYPYGSFDQQAINLVKRAGFTTAASTIPGNEQSELNRFFLFRGRPGDMTGQALLNYLNLIIKPYKT